MTMRMQYDRTHTHTPDLLQARSTDHHPRSAKQGPLSGALAALPTPPHAYVPVHAHVRAHSHARAHTHTCTHARARTHTHTVYYGHLRSDWFLELTKGCSLAGTQVGASPVVTAPRLVCSPEEKQFKGKRQIACIET